MAATSSISASTTRCRTSARSFAEVYREADTAALFPRRGGLADADPGMRGGQAIAVGLRYDF